MTTDELQKISSRTRFVGVLLALAGFISTCIPDAYVGSYSRPIITFVGFILALAGHIITEWLGSTQRDEKSLLQERLADLEHRQEQRTLSDNAVAEIKRMLIGTQTITKITIFTMGQHPEAYNLAKQLTSLFRSCGFTVAEPGMDGSPGPYPPLSVSVPDRFHINGPLGNALGIIARDIKCDGPLATDGKLATDELVIRIGQKQ